MKIHKLYVDTNSSKQGIGKALVECVKELAIASKINEIVLNVNRKNPAISFYQKINFEIDREEVIDIGEGYIMDDYIMKYTLPC
jgi:diamine N-acetyltransferase